MVRRAFAVGLGAAAVAGVAAAPAVAGSTPPAPRSHPVSLVWTTITTDDTPGRVQRDQYTSTGLPFGRSVVVTEALRVRDDRATFDFTGTNRRGRWEGVFFVVKTVVSSTRTRQVLDYRGTGNMDGGTGMYRRMRSTGRLTFRGRATCTVSGCSARFVITGNAVY